MDTSSSNAHETHLKRTLNASQTQLKRTSNTFQSHLKRTWNAKSHCFVSLGRERTLVHELAHAGDLLMSNSDFFNFGKRLGAQDMTIIELPSSPSLSSLLHPLPFLLSTALSSYPRSLSPNVLRPIENAFAWSDKWTEFAGRIPNQILEAIFGHGLLTDTLFSLIKNRW